MAITAGQTPIYASGYPKAAVADLNAASAGALASTTNAATVLTGATTYGSRVSGLIATTTDTSAVNLYVFLVDSGGTTIMPLAQVNVPLRSGDTAGTLATNMLLSTVFVGLPRDQNGNPYINVPPSYTLRVSTVANMTAAKHCYVTALYNDYQA